VAPCHEGRVSPTPTTQVELRQVTLGYADVVAVDAIDLRIEKGAFCTLLGPSGCGKTTLLRSIAGLVLPRSGDILINGRRVNDIPIHQRNIGLVFQNYALFPHKNVFDNVAFGLKYRRVDRQSIARRVSRALETVRLPGVEQRLPAQLSGGQQQRIALARAIVIEPDVLLLDEPLSALDANLREDMRAELKTIQRELGITTVFVTHDQEEALAISDRIVVMNRGRVEQAGTPEEVYRQPASRFVVNFMGRPNAIIAEVLKVAQDGLEVRLASGTHLIVPPAPLIAVGSKLEVVIRADRVVLEPADAPSDATPSATQPGAVGSSRANAIRGRVASIAFLGGTVAYLVDTGDLKLKAVVSIAEPTLRQGDAVLVSVAAEDCALFDMDGKRIAVERAAAQPATGLLT
jgi:ABC-type Fe3+/spermidine/putrescine transport system ATPase subunit